MNAYELQQTLVGRAAPPQRGRGAVAQSSRGMLQSVWQDAEDELARVAGAMGVPADQVDDVLQEVFVHAWERAPACEIGRAHV